MGLIAWNQSSDPYNSEELAENWIKVDQHDHTDGKGTLINTAALADQAVTATKIHPSAFPSLTIADNSIATAKYQDLSVTGAKMANTTVGTAQLATGGVTRAKIAASTLKTQRLVLSSAVTATATWSPVFPSANYTVSLAFQVGTTSYSYRIVGMDATVVVIDFNTALTGTLHVTAIHD